MTAELVSVATAVTAALNAGVVAGSFSQHFEAVRSYADWQEKLEDLNILHVDVAPAERGHQVSQMASRARRKYDVVIDVLVRKRFDLVEQESETGRIDIAEIDSLVALLEEIDQFFCLQRLTGYEAAAWKDDPRSGIAVTYRRDQLLSRMFSGFVRIVFDVRVTIT